MRFLLFCAMTIASATLVSCSDPVPPTPRGAWTAIFVQKSAVDCKQAGHTSKVGDVGPNTKAAVITDGTMGADISCSVAPASGGFNVDASASQADRFLLLAVDGISAAATEENPAKGILSYSSVNTIKSYSNASDTPCDFYFIPDSGEGIDKGKVWFAFKCPKIVDGAESTCEIQQGYAIFENCSEQ